MLKVHVGYNHIMFNAENFILCYVIYNLEEKRNKGHIRLDIPCYTIFSENREENPQKLTQLSSRSHPGHQDPGKKDSTKRHHHRHHKRQPGERQFPIQVVTG